jgi:tetratricopeptide (TPR) repeat protein
MRKGAVVFGLWSALAWAQPQPRLPELDKASEQVDSGDFEEAVKTLNQALAQPDLTDDQLAEAYRLLGLAHLYLGNEDSARLAFEKLLQARPDYELPKSAPPKIRSLYARIKDDVRKRRVKPVTLTFDAPSQVAGGEPLRLKVHVEDLALGARPRLFFRRGGKEAYSSVDLVKDKGTKTEFTATVPAFELLEEAEAYAVEYYLEVADAAQRRLAGKGDAFNPSSFKVKAHEQVAAAPPTTEAPSAWYKSPWLWVGLGVAVAAGVTTGVVLTTQNQTGTLPITVRIQGQP